MAKRSMFVGMDVHKESIDISLAEEGRDGEVRHYGRIAGDLEALATVAWRCARSVLGLLGVVAGPPARPAHTSGTVADLRRCALSGESFATSAETAGPGRWRGIARKSARAAVGRVTAVTTHRRSPCRRERARPRVCSRGGSGWPASDTGFSLGASAVRLSTALLRREAYACHGRAVKQCRFSAWNCRLPLRAPA